ncbi:MAG TPA: aminotransferase class IV [Segetibacter sp.]|jgi:branched-chain amino acid aminotransferase
MSLYAIYNGKLVREEQIYISPNNRSFRYGDGCFETMKVVNGNLLLASFHFKRLFNSLNVLKFIVPAQITPAVLEEQVLQLVLKNGQQQFSRVRFVAFRGSGGLYENDGNAIHYIIQSFTGNPSTNIYNKEGLSLEFYKEFKKATDTFSALKTNNFLGYSMGAIWAKENGLDDCIISNAFNRIADATIANIFIVSDGIIKTPGITEGCVNGVMRRYLLNCFSTESIPFAEQQLTSEDILSASEIFLTNANYGIRWVKRVGPVEYLNSVSAQLYYKFIAPLFNPSTFLIVLLLLA